MDCKSCYPFDILVLQLASVYEIEIISLMAENAKVMFGKEINVVQLCGMRWRIFCLFFSVRSILVLIEEGVCS